MKSRLIIVLLCIVMVMAGCGTLKHATNSSCKELLKVRDRLDQGILIANVAHQKDPNIITQAHIVELTRIRDIVGALSIEMCIISDLIPDKLDL